MFSPISALYQKTDECYSSKFQIHVIELNKLEETPNEERGDLYRWARLLAAKDWDSVRMTAAGDPYMEEVEKIMIKMSQDERERYLYLRESMAYTDEISRLNTAKNEGVQEGIQIGIQEGLQKGIQEGIQKGIQEGIQKGIQEGIQNLVDSLHELDVPKDYIVSKLMDKYGLSKDDAELKVRLYSQDK